MTIRHLPAAGSLGPACIVITLTTTGCGSPSGLGPRATSGVIFEINANPNPVPAGPTRSSTTVTWSSAAVRDAEVWVSVNGNSETLFAKGELAGRKVAELDRGSVHEYRLYADASRRVRLASVTVEAENVTPIERRAGLLLGLCAAALLLTLQRRIALLIGAGLTLVIIALSWVNRTKIDLTQAPLTALDFKIAVADPRGLWTAMQWPQWSLWVVGLLTIAVAIGLGVVVAGNRRYLAPPWPRDRPLRGWLVLVFLSIFLGVCAWTGPEIAKRALDHPRLWEAQGLAGYSKDIGIVPFLLFSYHLETTNTGAFHDASLSGTPLDASELSQVISTVVRRPRTSELPNIVVLFGESTFNPDWAFELSTPVDSPLFEPQADTQVLSPLHVNVVGGGSWIEEFESLVGVDSRLFGYAGYYTHSTLSPFVRKSFVTYLKEKGYDTAAYYAWSGAFYNARRAFANYGFHRFYDGADLALATAGSDVAIANAALIRTRRVEHGPFFAFVGLAENHAPHPCRHFKRPEDFGPRFAATHDFRMTCALNEYARRLQSTWAAFQEWSTYLRELERSTGRPYVVAIFGDHQPHTFTANAASLSDDDYASVRTAASLRQTFLHLRSSIQGMVNCCRTPPPVTLLPSLLSAFTASGVDDLYLPESFYLYQHCGSDLLGGSVSLGVYDSEHKSADATTAPNCRTALARSLVSLRISGIF